MYFRSEKKGKRFRYYGVEYAIIYEQGIPCIRRIDGEIPNEIEYEKITEYLKQEGIFENNH
jgi:hypothetical protein